MTQFRCDGCSKTKVGFYPKRVSVAAKMSPYKFCSPQCQQAHWRQRRRRIPRPPTFCGHCGNIMPREDRPGRPRRYCSPSHQQAAANRRRPGGSPTIAVLEDAVRKSDLGTQAARAAVDVQIKQVAAAKLQLEKAKTERLAKETSLAKYQTGINPAVAAQQAVAAALGLVGQLYAAHREYAAAGRDDKQYRLEAFNKLSARVNADELASQQHAANGPAGELQKAKVKAEDAADAAESARAALQTARARLDRRAQQARIRRARAAGEDPEEEPTEETGEITVNAALDHETEDEYTLTVEADDGNGQTDTVTVTVTVTDVAEDAPPSPGNLGVTLSSGTFTLSWDVVTGAAKYEAQHTTDAADAATVTWTALSETTGTTQDYAPAGGVACGTEYRFRVRAYGDGTAYVAEWGVESGAESVTTESCPPEFDEASYAFSVAEDAEIDDDVGTVSATDQDEDDEVSYAIRAGNTGTAFAIDEETGAITVNVALDHETEDEYTLTVEADDGNGQTDTVTVTVTDVAETPVFDEASYAFSVAEDAEVDDVVGTVSATDPDEDDTVSYAITAGNTGTAFDIDEETGAITVNAALDHETEDEYTLTVEADDGNGKTDTVTVTITVTDVVEDAPPAPTGIDASLTGGVFSLSWTALAGAAKYEAQHTTDAADAATVTWTELSETTGTTQDYAPADGVACNTEYRFRVRAYGNGTAYVAEWGLESGLALVTSGPCDNAPEFGESSYALTVAEDAATTSSVGTVEATDPDVGDTVSYSITGGNDDGKFAINSTTGEITVAGSLDPDELAFYVLTVEARDLYDYTALLRSCVHRKAHLREVLPTDVLPDCVEEIEVPLAHERHRSPLASHPGGAADPVHVLLDMFRDIVVDNV